MEEGGDGDGDFDADKDPGQREGFALLALSIDDEHDAEDEVEPVGAEGGKSEEGHGVEEVALPVGPLVLVVAGVELGDVALPHPVAVPHLRAVREEMHQFAFAAVGRRGHGDHGRRGRTAVVSEWKVVG